MNQDYGKNHVMDKCIKKQIECLFVPLETSFKVLLGTKYLVNYKSATSFGSK